MNKMKKYIKKETIPWLVLLSVGLSLGLKFLFFNSIESSEVADITSLTSSSNEDKEASEENRVDEKMYVDIKGAIKKPGMYEVTSTMRVLNVIDLAGGLTNDADDKQINFSERLEDQMIIYVPKEGEEVPEIKVSDKKNENKSSSQSSDKININQAEKDELMTLNGVGEKKAEKIIEYREENGSFKSVEDLKNVNGFGEKTFESLKESIIV